MAAMVLAMDMVMVMATEAMFTTMVREVQMLSQKPRQVESMATMEDIARESMVMAMAMDMVMAIMDKISN